MVRGRKPKYVVDDNGRPVVGLSFDKANQNYYNTHFKIDNIKKVIFGKDRIESIFRFRKWEMDRNSEEVDILEGQVEVVHKHADYYSPMDALTGRIPPPLPEDLQNIYKVPESFIWEKARYLLLTAKPQEIYKKLGLHITIDDRPPTKFISLKKLGEIYFEGKELSRSHKYYSQSYWKEFIRVIGVTNIGDISSDGIYKYQDFLTSKGKRKKWGSSSMNNRITAIKTIIRYGSIYCRDETQTPKIKEMLGMTDKLIMAKKQNGGKPEPISKEDYQLILENETNPIYRAIWLFALNTACRQTNLCAVKWTDIDMEQKTFSMPRPKTSIIRSAILWDRTMQALKELPKNDSEYVVPVRPRTISTWFRQKRLQLKMNKQVKFEHLRDAAASIPIHNGGARLENVAVLLGHLFPGQANEYVTRHPQVTKSAVEAIEQYYFGKK